MNGHDLKNASQEEAAPVLKMAQGRIAMCVRRLKVFFFMILPLMGKKSLILLSYH